MFNLYIYERMIKVGLNDGGSLPRNVLCYYKEALSEVTEYLSSMLKYFCDINSIEYMHTERIKQIDSIDDKIKRKNCEELYDIAGMRVVFCDADDRVDLNELDSIIHQWNKETFVKEFSEAVKKCNNGYLKAIYDFIDFLEHDDKYNLVIKKDYISNPKCSGYQSYHVVLIASNGYPVEIQFRNLVQHYFAEFEHDVRYKADSNTRNEYNSVCDKCASILFDIRTNYFYSDDVNDFEHSSSINTLKYEKKYNSTLQI